MGKHMEGWARARMDADYPEGAVRNAWMDELARAILADAEEQVEIEAKANTLDCLLEEADTSLTPAVEQNEPAHPYYWRPWETRPKDAYVLAHWDDVETAVIHPSWLDAGDPAPDYWMPLPPEPTDDA